MKGLWIELVDKGIANRFDFGDHEVIELNWRLTLYPELYQRVYQHELDHASGGFTAKDLFHDMKSKTPGIHTFMRKHISAWTQILPVYYDRNRKRVFYDISNIVMWITLLGMSTATYLFMRWLL